MGLDHVGLLVGGSLLLLLPQLLDQGHRLPEKGILGSRIYAFENCIHRFRGILPFESPGELPPDPADKQLHQLLVVHVKELVKVDPPGEKVEGK